MNIKLTKKSFYILSFSWGIIYTLAGLFMALIMIITGHKAKRWGWAWYFEVGKNPWGGADWGIFFLKDKFSGDHTKCHEFGHAIQNCIFGPFMIVLVCLPSTIRYWVRRVQLKTGHTPKKDYDSIWFEGQATRLGKQIIEKIRLSSVNSHNP